MVEGWNNEDYLTLFDEHEIDSLTSPYGLTDFLPGYRLVGLRSWDDFIVEDGRCTTFTVPTVPLAAKYLEPYTVPSASPLQPDERLAGRIKWCIKPIAFGGDPQLGDNLTWVPIAKHAELVKWWNDRYRELTANT